jgi:hypothetical protein
MLGGFSRAIISSIPFLPVPPPMNRNTRSVKSSTRRAASMMVVSGVSVE